MFAPFSWTAMLGAAAAGWVVSMIWYAPPIFGNRWQAVSGMTKETMRPMAQVVPLWIATLLVIAAVMSFLAGHLSLVGIVDGLLLGFLCWLGFAATTHFIPFIFEHKPFALVALNAAGLLASYLAMGLATVLLH